ncbi:MAG: serine hydrolase [Spirochaetia bacterium]|nr:serine hydrolase [Spirochaetia bacterium]
MAMKNIDNNSFQMVLNNLVLKKNIKQAILTVENSDRSFQWTGIAGEINQDDVQVNANSPFFIASIDKIFNATIIMLLSEQGKLNLDDPISDYLPSELFHRLHTYKGIDYSKKITIRHLLSHTSGLGDWLEDSPKGGKSVVEQILTQGDMAFSFIDIAEIVRIKLKPHFPPQNPSGRKIKVRYSDTNYILIIALIEAICNAPLHIVHENMLYKPLSLKNTYFPGFSQPLVLTQLPIPLRAGGQIVQIPKLMKSFRGIYSTTRDMIAFLRKLIQNQVFNKKDTFNIMQNNWNRFGLPLDRASLRSPGWPIEYGLGLMRFQLPRIFTSMKKLPEVIGHTGSTGCWLFWCPQLDLYLCGSVDETSAGAVPYRVIPEILKAMY